MDRNPLVSIIIPTYNRKYQVTRLIESIKRSSYPQEDTEIIVVDDSSTDGTRHAIRSRFPEVKVVENAQRKMTSGARNTGMKCSKGDYLLLVDHDNVIDRQTIRQLVNFMERNEKVGLVGPVMYYYCEPKTIWCAGGRLRRPLCIQTHILQYENSDSLPLAKIHEIECEFIPNAFMLRRQITSEVGFFDEENFPILWEDIDFSLRIKQRGYRVVIVPQAKVWHDVSTVRDFHIDEERAFFRGRNRARFYLKHAPSRVVLLPIDMLGFCVALFAYDRSSSRIRKALQYLRGISQGLIQMKPESTSKKEHP